jgi:transcription-repair coupling factor (superfamily II helicase)
LAAGERDYATIRAVAGIRPALVAAMAQRMSEDRRSTGKSGPHPPVIVVTASTSAAEEMATAASSFILEEAIAVLPAWETLPHERLSPRADTLGKRTAVFRRLAHPEPSGPFGAIELLITPLRSVLQPVVKGLGEIEPVVLKTGQQADLAVVAERLAALAYNRVDMVTARGEFAVRGGILDVFPPTEDHALRVDFWGDEVDEIRYFSVSDQRSSDLAENGLWASPCRELLLTASVKDRARALAPLLPGVGEMLEKIAAGMAVEGMESLTPALAEAMTPVLSLAPRGALMIFVEPERLRRRAEDLLATADEFLQAAWEAAAIGADSPVDLSSGSYLTLNQLRQQAVELGCGWWTVGSLAMPDAADQPPDSAGASDAADQPPDSGPVIEVGARELDNFNGRIDRALKQLKAWAKDGWRLILTTEGTGPAKRLTDRLGQEGVPARLAFNLADSMAEVCATGAIGSGDGRTVTDGELGGGIGGGDGVVTVTTASGIGYRLPSLKLAVVSERDLVGKRLASTRDMRRMPSRRKAAVDPLQLKRGDLVVHRQHGIGRFIEMVDRTTGAAGNTVTREYLVIEYAPSRRGQAADRLFVPTDSLDQLTRYVGGEQPPLNKLGGTEWAKTKAKARAAVSQLAAELARLYAARMATKGFAFSPDTPWQRELEDAFAYVETPDQLTTIDEVKADMRQPTPMDRLVCGDVGYGKTEIAVRAAFKAVQDGKQVAVLAPTTVLVRQHAETFSDRYAPFPVEVRSLSRFQSASSVRQTKQDLAEGKVDVVIGTHALVQGDVRFKDLGLVVIDEEQRFGVEHKETLKAQKPEVDVLSMSATPIPRTLEMAVSGIREMSTLTTPPEERHPVLTYVGAATPAQVLAAIRRELLREGQVFYVHNRVQSINKVAAGLRTMLPEARIEIAHGQMAENRLEQVMLDFWEKRFDVLVCTTIIETGLDIANANTLIVDNADKFGLAQLHQLRGRVGRGKERAYAYFLYDPQRPLTETAHERLSTIASQSELGAGMQVALKDLEIRGAGNLLGAEQSGHIAGVGFDLYLRMIGEAVAAAKGKAVEPPAEIQIELPVAAYIPQTYIEGDRLRLEVYTKLADAASDTALRQVEDELTDRYGAIPADVAALFDLAKLRLAARLAGLTQVVAQGRYINLFPALLAESQQLWLKRVVKGTIIKPATRRLLVPIPRTGPRLTDEAMSGVELVAWVRQLIEDLIERTPKMPVDSTP